MVFETNTLDNMLSVVIQKQTCVCHANPTLEYTAQHKRHFALWTFTFHSEATQQTKPGHLGPAQTSSHAIKNKYLVSQEGFAAIQLIKLSKILEVPKQSDLKT